MKIPTELKHKPVIVCENYEQVDGRTAYSSEAKGLSIGLAQWNDRGRVDAAAKVWRYTGEKWSRQSEELPLHRVLDLAILLARSMQYMREEAYRLPDLYDSANPVIGRIGVQGDAMTLRVCVDNPHIAQDMALLQDAFAKDGELLGERFAVLASILSQMGY